MGWHMIATGKRPQCWPLSVRLLHWATVPLVIGLFVSGWIPGAHGVSSLHVTFGVVLLAVLLVRIILRLATRGPATLAQRPLLRLAWRIGQLLLYISVLAAIVSGLAAFSPHPFMPQAKLFGAVTLPWILPLTPGLRQLAAWSHGILVWIMLGVVTLHVGAVIAHGLVSGPAMLRRMTRGT